MESANDDLRYDLDELAQILYSAVVSDSCDRQGLRYQTASPGLFGVTVTSPILIGWARTVEAIPVARPPLRPYGAEIDYVDSLRSGDVIVANTLGSTSGFWGELFSTAATGRGARGAVIDGLVRDQDKMTKLGFPVYAAGSRPADSLGRLSIVQQDHPVAFRGVEVSSGDLVVADIDGIVIVPRSVVRHVLEYAIEKAGVENDARALLLKGGKLADVWERHHVL